MMFATLVPVLAVWIGTDLEWSKKLWLMGIYVAIWAIAVFVTGWAYCVLILYAVFLYFLFFGSGSGRRWRP